MIWRERVRRAPEPSRPSESASGVPGPAERASPGLAALFESLGAGAVHSVLDLGPANGRHLKVLSRVARQIRFAGLVPRSCVGEAWAVALRALPPNVDFPYDVVLAWDLLNLLDPDERAAAMTHLADITASRARLHVIVDGTGATTIQPLAFTLLEPGRIAEQATGPRAPVSHPLLPAQVERVLAPFEVVRAFVLRTGVREYVAMKRERST